MLCLPIMAGERSEQQMLEAAARVLFKQPLARSVSEQGPEMTLHIVQRRSAVTIVGSDSGGFALVSNDVSQRPVLGYSHEGVFASEGDMPCGLKWYLDALDESLSKQPSSRAAILPNADVKPFVEPLIETDWWQVSPYNDWLPSYTNEDGMTKHFYTGCAMTAAAQLMYYYKYPQKPHGQIAYSFAPFEDGHPVQISCNLDTIFFNWNRIAARYNDHRSGDEQENIEVARLFYAIGNAWHAQYKPSGTVNGINYFYPFYSNFDYAHDCIERLYDNYNGQLWMDILFEELSCGHPVIYRGEPSAPDNDVAGHVFIVDGYDVNGLIHVNWGWGRVRGFDGYFSIDALVPNGYNHDFTAAQAMFAYIRPEGMPLSMKEIVVSTPGTLGHMLSCRPHDTRLKISGQLNVDDLQTLKQLGQHIRGSDGLICAELTHLDLSEAILPDDALPERAFESCTALLDVVLPASLKTIGNQAFIGCYNLTHISMPSGLLSVGDFAFLNCSNLTDIVIPRDVETIGRAAFGNCTSNEAFVVEGGNSHFSTIDGILTNAEGTKLICFPAKREEASIPESIDTIGQFAFRASKYLTKLHIPATIRVIEEYAFMSCISLTQLDIEEGLEEIGAYAFYGCNAMTDVYCLVAKPIRLGNYVFAQADLSTVTLHVPQDCRSAYQSSTGWNQFGTIVEDLPNSVGSITIERISTNSKSYDLMGRPFDARNHRPQGIVIEQNRLIIKKK